MNYHQMNSNNLKTEIGDAMYGIFVSFDVVESARFGDES